MDKPSRTFLPPSVPLNTQGKRLVVVVSQRKALALAVSNNKTEQRFSGLLSRLRAYSYTDVWSAYPIDPLDAMDCFFDWLRSPMQEYRLTRESHPTGMVHDPRRGLLLPGG